MFIQFLSQINRLLFFKVMLFVVMLALLANNAISQQIKKDLWTINAIDTTNYTPAYLGNGIVGLRSQKSGLGAERVVINGLYDRSPLGDYVRLINNYNPVNIKIVFSDKKELQFGEKVKDWKQTLKLKEAILETSYIYGTQLEVKTQMVALRNLPMATMVIYEFKALEDIEFTVLNAIAVPDRSKALGVYKTNLNYGLYSLSTTIKEKIPVMSAAFPTETGNDCISGANTFFFNGQTPQLNYVKLNNFKQQLSFSVKLKKGEKYSFCMLSAFTHSQFTSDPYNDAVRICSRDYNLGYKHLMANHKAAWAKLWESDIEIEGDDEAQIDARLALYSLYASIAKGFELSIPPTGLAETGWGGHIFWDAELWMYPPMLVMQPSLAASMVDFRYNTLGQAKKRAAQFGYQGAMYPWESDLQGNECTPIAYKLDMNEHHVTADVAISAWNYYKVTKDRLWLQQRGFPLIREIAEFWVSRASKDEKGNYHIKNVVGPDEYHEDVDDDAFTNGAVKVVLDAAIESAKLLNEQINPDWQNVSKGMVILKHKDGYTLQNSQYTGQRIKQADVNLLAFPLDLITDKTQILKDLQYYEPKIDPNGPSMSYSVLATSYARMGQAGKAYQLYQKGYQPNRKAPFGFISEKPGKSVTVFCTGYGGMLQTIIFGFAGMKIGEDGLYQEKANLPLHWKKLTLKMSGKEDIVCSPSK
ncbi:glycoside hydrolase family 65 protein [Pedobacter frigiditerrae]|uniref:Glycoside hydrolase family 65 protein n=1 Tax=Pedobacter frigiditerrae TaxID=2530452 RepID=A0A4R0MPH3_9SPHI|nr:glycoside hydrolase family 65 protein [Pedobacter frigiditerrae]TCC88728.1 glycoside hydrolase family 65 protein [Pedobacter frigiditerrae]